MFIDRNIVEYRGIRIVEMLEGLWIMGWLGKFYCWRGKFEGLRVGLEICR